MILFLILLILLILMVLIFKLYRTLLFLILFTLVGFSTSYVYTISLLILESIVLIFLLYKSNYKVIINFILIFLSYINLLLLLYMVVVKIIFDIYLVIIVIFSIKFFFIIFYLNFNLINGKFYVLFIFIYILTSKFMIFLFIFISYYNSSLLFLLIMFNISNIIYFMFIFWTIMWLFSYRLLVVGSYCSFILSLFSFSHYILLFFIVTNSLLSSICLLLDLLFFIIIFFYIYYLELFINYNSYNLLFLFIIILFLLGIPTFPSYLLELSFIFYLYISSNYIVMVLFYFLIILSFIVIFYNILIFINFRDSIKSYVLTNIFIIIFSLSLGLFISSYFYFTIYLSFLSFGKDLIEIIKSIFYIILLSVTLVLFWGFVFLIIKLIQLFPIALWYIVTYMFSLVWELVCFLSELVYNRVLVYVFSFLHKYIFSRLYSVFISINKYIIKPIIQNPLDIFPLSVLIFDVIFPLYCFYRIIRIIYFFIKFGGLPYLIDLILYLGFIIISFFIIFDTVLYFLTGCKGKSILWDSIIKLSLRYILYFLTSILPYLIKKIFGLLYYYLGILILYIRNSDFYISYHLYLFDKLFIFICKICSYISNISVNIYNVLYHTIHCTFPISSYSKPTKVFCLILITIKIITVLFFIFNLLAAFYVEYYYVFPYIYSKLFILDFSLLLYNYIISLFILTFIILYVIVKIIFIHLLFIFLVFLLNLIVSIIQPLLDKIHRWIHS